MIPEPKIGRVRKCHVPVCLVQIPEGQAVCAAHWEQIPAEMRQEITRAHDYGAITGDFGGKTYAWIKAIEHMGWRR